MNIRAYLESKCKLQLLSQVFPAGDDCMDGRNKPETSVDLSKMVKYSYTYFI